MADYRATANAHSFRNKAFINGKHVDAASGKTFDCTSPIDGRVLTKIVACDLEKLYHHAVWRLRAIWHWSRQVIGCDE